MRQRIDQLGAVGLNTDVQEPALPGNAWTKLFNCATQDGSLRTVPGERKLFDLDIRPTYHYSYIDASQIQRLIVSDGITVWAYDMQGTGEEITPLAGDFTGGYVSFCSLNGVLVVNSNYDGAFYWPGTGNELVALPDWSANWRCREMRAYRYYLVALGMTESSVEYPHKIRWSTAAPDGDIPAEWVPSASNEAGDDLLGETEGVIIGGVLSRNSLFIIKEDAIYSMDWIGGDYIMQTQRLKGGIGTRLQRGFAEMLGRIVTFNTSDLLAFDGNTSQSLVDQRIRRALAATISDEFWDMSQLYVHYPSSTLWVAGVEAGHTRLSSALVYNWEENTWGHRKLAYGYGFDSAFVSFSAGLPQWNDLFEGATGTDADLWVIGGTWDDQNIATWNKGVYQASQPDVVVYESSDDDTAWWVSVTGIPNLNENSDGSAKTCQAQRIGIPIEGADGLAMITECWPEIEGSLPIRIRFGGQMSENGEINWDNFMDFTPGTDFVVTPRVTGRFLCVDIESFGIGWWRLAALTFNWQRAGER